MISVDNRSGWTLSVVARRVLIIDDDPIVMAIAADLLVASGYTVRTAHTVSDFYREAVGWNPELVLVDLFMPEMDGDELCRTVKARLPAIPLIMFSSADEKTLAEIAHSCGADGYIDKREGLTDLVPRLHELERTLW